MPCAYFETLLLDYHELDPEERTAVDEHLVICSECSSFLASLDSVDDELRQYFSEVRSPADLTQADLTKIVRRRIAAEAFRKRFRVPEILEWVGAAAMLAVAGMLLYAVVPQFLTMQPITAVGAVVSAGVLLTYVTTLLSLRSE